MEKTNRMTTPIYLAMDIESGGITSHFSLLSVYFAVLDDEFNILDDLDLKIKPDDGVYILSAGGMAVNKIDIVEHDKTAICEKEAATKIYDFVKKHSDNGKTKLIPLGHNVSFDIGFIVNKTLSKKSWDQFVGYRVLDTGGMAMILITAKKLPKDFKAGLGHMAEYFKAPAFEAHTAKGDVEATIFVAKKLLEMI